jgi:hypothetical protein
MPTVLPTIAAGPDVRTALATIGRPRPPVLRALGASDPPPAVTVGGQDYRIVTTFKHDSWAASALYEGANGARIVCKFNRTQPILAVPMSWLGRALARRECRMLEELADEPLVPGPCGDVAAGGRLLPNCVAHEYVSGRPLSRRLPLRPEFFTLLTTLVSRVHARGIAYVDLHKRENILVGDDGRPYLIDFQISMLLPTRGPLSVLLRTLQRCDAYHLSKHIRRGQVDAGLKIPRPRGADRPWSIRLHRRIAVPFRTARRHLLVSLGVRTYGGRAHTEAEPEVGAVT